MLHHGVRINFPDGVFELPFELAFEFALELTLPFPFKLALAFAEQAADHIADRAQPALAFYFAFELAFEFTLTFEFAFELGFQFELGLIRHDDSSSLTFSDTLLDELYDHPALTSRAAAAVGMRWALIRAAYLEIARNCRRASFRTPQHAANLSRSLAPGGLARDRHSLCRFALQVLHGAPHDGGHGPHQRPGCTPPPEKSRQHRPSRDQMLHDAA